MSRHAMLWLEHWLRRRGYLTCAHSYPSVRRSLDHNAALLAREIARETSGDCDVVCHSYGGVVMLRMLALELPLHVRRIVLLGSPVSGSSAGRRLAAHPVGHWLLGQTRSLWRNGVSLAIPAGVEVGAIAGSRAIGLGRVVSSVEGPNDGVVALEETRLEGLADHVTIDCAHTAMLFSPKVARQIEFFLLYGSFER
jgi:pimeloyl-ACP methyl ester carboxylesterase